MTTAIRMPEVKLWPVVRLAPYLRNPRTHTQDQVATMARLMRKFGWTDAIVVDESNGILAGHLRYAAALHMGLKEVPVVEVTHLTPEEKRAFVVGHNSIALKSKWDPLSLHGELTAIEDPELLELAGYSEAELAALDAQVEAAVTQDAAEGDAFRPNTQPEQDGRTWDQGDMDRARDTLADRLKREEILNKVVCPHCHGEFYLQGKE